MSGVLESVRDYAQNHPMSVAAGLIIALPGTYFYVTGKSITCAVGLCGDAPSPSFSPVASITRGLSVYDSQYPLDWRLKLPISRWSDKPASAFVIQVVEDAGRNIVLFLTSVGDMLGIDVQRILQLVEDRWATHFPLSRLISVAVSTALPGAFLVFIRNHPGSWAARHQTNIANALHVFALVTVANQRISVQDLLVTALVMVSFEALQRTLKHDSEEPPAAIETLLSQTHTVVAKSDLTGSPERRNTIDKSAQVDNETTILTTGPRDEEIVRLHKTLTEAKTAEKAKEHDLKRTNIELKNARATLDETFQEYTSLRDEMKTMKQTLGRDHQAIIYRKDIELFALRKANEQKETYIKEREMKLEDIYRQQKATLELKEAQIKNLKERVAFLERQESPRLNGEVKVDSAVDSDSQEAVQVKLLRIQGRSSLDVERTIDEKDTEIGRLKLDLARALSAGEAMGKSQDELHRAWDATFEAQNALSEERQRHAQTQGKLQEAAVLLDEEFQKNSQKNSPTRLPTIEEQDKKELEAMFNATQQDNLRLYNEVEALDKRVREANARLFSSEQEAEALREQLNLEKAINEDMETARPSVVHRVHFQRMEGQLKDSREAIEAKDDEIELLKKGTTENESRVAELESEKASAVKTKTELEEENERLKQSISALEATKEQLMLDHERLAQHRARQRTSSAEHTSARSSNATLITDPTAHVVTSDEPLPARPVSIGADGSIQGTPERHLRSDTNRLSLISNEVPPPELRQARRKSLTLKGLMRKITKKDEAEDKVEKSAKEDKKGKEREKEKESKKEKERPKTALIAKDKNTLMRPKTAAPVEPAAGKKEVVKGKQDENDKVDKRPKTAAAAASVSKEKDGKSTPTRYYAAQSKPDTDRPKTAAPTAPAVNDKKVDEKAAASGIESPRPKSRGWGASRKLVRKSIA